MVSKKRVIFSGSRDWKHETSVVEALVNLDPDEWIVVHGAAKGLDKLADEYARAMGFEVESYPAKWAEYGNAAGPIRNRLMLSRENVQLVIAFPMPQSVGTVDMIEIAEAADVPVVVMERP